jgi:CheY-like chemotaxis protein
MKRIVIVDDNEILTNFMSKLVERELEDVAATTCNSACELRRLFEGSERFDAVILDWTLPDGDGASVLAEVRAAWPSAPIVLVSGTLNDVVYSGVSEIFSEGIQIDGVAGVISKPFEPLELIAKLLEVLWWKKKHLHAKRERPADSLEQWLGSGKRVSEPPQSNGRIRHDLINCLSRMLSGVRAFEADLVADADRPERVRNYSEEYVDRFVDCIHEMNALVAKALPRQEEKAPRE